VSWASTVRGSLSETLREGTAGERTLMASKCGRSTVGTEGVTATTHNDRKASCVHAGK
jgi:hypothetical protein